MTEKQAAEEEDDPLHVWYTTVMFLTAMDLGIMRFSLRRTQAGLVVEAPDSRSGDLRDFVRNRPSRDCSGNEADPPPADLVWDRVLEMAGMSDQASAGTIGICQRSRYPHTDWTVVVARTEPNLLGFEITLDRVHVSVPKEGGTTKASPNE